MLKWIKDRMSFVFLSLFLSSFVSCATEKEAPRLVSDPDDRPESSIPWNRQEKWEIGGGIPSELGEQGRY